MMNKLARSEIAKRELSNSFASQLHFDKRITRIIESGSKCNFRCPWGLISC